MEDQKIKQIADFWLSNKFLERFKAIGDKYIKDLEATKSQQPPSKEKRACKSLC